MENKNFGHLILYSIRIVFLYGFTNSIFNWELCVKGKKLIQNLMGFKKGIDKLYENCE